MFQDASGTIEGNRAFLAKRVKILAPSRPFKVSVAIWLLVSLTLLLLPFRLLNYGYLPTDDALRHAAKAISGKPWQQILVMRPDITIDHNPGWHWILAALHHLAHWDARTLVAFSVVSMFLVFASAPLPWLKRPEAWLASLAIVMLVCPYYADRVFLGRPLLITVGVSLALLSLWTHPDEKEISRIKLAVTASLIAIATCVHGTWYLLVLLPLAFFLARLWRKGLLLTLCWAIGSFAGALLTGEPLAFLKQSILIPFLALGQHAPPTFYVTEFQPYSGSYPALIPVVVVLVWRWLTRRPLQCLLRDPVLWLAFLGCLLGFYVVRFWLDWGIPALALWLARQIQEALEAHLEGKSYGRLPIGCLAALVLLLGPTSDHNARWSRYGHFECLDANQPDQAAWLPAPGGILYNLDLSVFYQTFFKNPHGEWRYVLGFEPTFMRPEDLAVHLELCRTLNAIHSCAPWVKRMTPADRLVLLAGPRTRPAIPELEWHYTVSNTWVGRLPVVSRSQP